MKMEGITLDSSIISAVSRLFYHSIDKSLLYSENKNITLYHLWNESNKLNTNGVVFPTELGSLTLMTEARLIKKTKYNFKLVIR